MSDQACRIGVGVFVHRGVNILLGKRQGSHGSGSWALCGGRVELGDSICETASKEVLEELGIKKKAQDFVLCNVSTVDVMDGVKWTTFYVRLFLLEGEEPTRMEPEKCAVWDWFPIRQQLPSPLFAPLKQLVDSPKVWRVFLVACVFVCVCVFLLLKLQLLSLIVAWVARRYCPNYQAFWERQFQQCAKGSVAP